MKNVNGKEISRVLVVYATLAYLFSGCGLLGPSGPMTINPINASSSTKAATSRTAFESFASVP